MNSSVSRGTVSGPTAYLGWGEGWGLLGRVESRQVGSVQFMVYSVPGTG